ncbi:MAG: short-chain dehydrogenase/reductase [Frankiales bacterium]|nr:short-chain dehydrogenase/reductase [Frankiales bacterium]
MSLTGAVVVVAGAGGGAGEAVARRLADGGAIVVLGDHTLQRIGPLAAELTDAGAAVHPFAVDLLDEAATAEWARSVVARFGRVDGLVHLVGGWRGGKGITDTDLADWDWLAGRLVRTVQLTSRGFHDALLASPLGRFVLVSATAASRPTARNASYAAAKAAAEAWTLAVADSFREAQAAATVVVVKALLTPAMREANPDAAYDGFTDVADLADVIAALWDKAATEVNGERVWLTM